MSKRICSIADCAKPVFARQWCGPHYRKWLKYGNPLEDRRPRREKCKAPGCESLRDSRGYCPKHYGRAKARGEFGPHPTCSVSWCTNTAPPRGLCPTHIKRQKLGQDLEAPLRPKAAYRDPEILASLQVREGDCLVWKGEVNANGYGYIYVGKPIKMPVHRWVYEQDVGPIPKGHDIDHICGNRLCCEPSHLRPATRKQNLENFKSLRTNNKSGYRGVFWDTQKGKWAAKVRSNYRDYNAGFYDDVHEAGAAARAMRNRLYTHNDRDRAGGIELQESE